MQKMTMFFFLFPLLVHAAVPEVFFSNVHNGASVTSPLHVKMAVKGMKLRPAGEAVDDTKSGHFHVLIDKAPIAKGEFIPADASDLHFGKAQKEATLTLAPGAHTITLLFGDGAHRSYGPELSQTLHITVK